jgi:hypothetical protein
MAEAFLGGVTWQGRLEGGKGGTTAQRARWMAVGAAGLT